MTPLQTVQFTGQSATVLYRGAPTYRVADPSQARVAERLARLAGESAAADYIITVGERL